MQTLYSEPFKGQMGDKVRALIACRDAVFIFLNIVCRSNFIIFTLVFCILNESVGSFSKGARDRLFITPNSKHNITGVKCDHK